MASKEDVSGNHSLFEKKDILNIICHNIERMSFFTPQFKKFKRSPVWNTFEKIQIDKKDVNYVRCIKCHAIIAYDNTTGTSGMLRHNQKCCQKVFDKNDLVNDSENKTKAKVVNDIQKITNFAERIPPRASKNQLNTSIVLGLAKDCRPLSSVGNVGFLHIAQQLINFGAKHGRQSVENCIMDRTTLTKSILPEIYSQEEQKIKAMLKKESSFPKFAFTFDMWTDQYQYRKFLSMCIHFIDENWELVTKMLGVNEFEGESATTLNVKLNCQNILNTFFEKNEVTKIFEYGIVITDNGSNVMDVFKLRFPCYCHRLNTYVGWILRDEPSPNEKKIREMAAKGKPLKAKHLFCLSEQCPRIKACIADIKSLVTFFKRSELNSKLEHTLKQNVCTRFNSQLIMLKSYLAASVQIKQILLDRNDLHKIARIDDDLVKELIDFLQFFDECSKTLSGDNYPTFHLVALWISKLQSHIQVRDIDSVELQNLKKQAATCFDDYCKLDDLYYVACMFDPRLHLISECHVIRYIYFLIS